MNKYIISIQVEVQADNELGARYKAFYKFRDKLKASEKIESSAIAKDVDMDIKRV